jgi:hypothetical protein
MVFREALPPFRAWLRRFGPGLFITIRSNGSPVQEMKNRHAEAWRWSKVYDTMKRTKSELLGTFPKGIIVTGAFI